MQIHTVEAGETLYTIARRYSLPVTKILSDNGLISDRLTVGDELLILTPTRTVTVRGGDTIESISKRFDIKPRAILTQNPCLLGKKRLRPGQVLTVKQDTAFIGSASALGIIKKGCSHEKLRQSMPYMTYVVVDAGTITDRLNITFDTEYTVNLSKSEGKIVILGVRDESGGSLLISKDRESEIIDSLIKTAKERGFMGIKISSPLAVSAAKKFSEFLLESRKRFIGCDLILFTDVPGIDAAEASELSDGAILKFPENIEISDSKKLLHDFASHAESSKVFVYLPSYIRIGDGGISIDDAKTLCYRCGNVLSSDKVTLLSEFEYTKYKTGIGETVRIAFPSLQYIKAKLETLCELGFIGISFDVDSRPTSYLTMFNAMFARADYSL